jgi:hypothetical protein
MTTKESVLNILNLTFVDGSTHDIYSRQEVISLLNEIKNQVRNLPEEQPTVDLPAILSRLEKLSDEVNDHIESDQPIIDLRLDGSEIITDVDLCDLAQDVYEKIQEVKEELEEKYSEQIKIG